MKTWTYASSANVTVGMMVCAVCSKQITGLYRYRETEKAFISQHRACSATDKAWMKLDARDATSKARASERLAAYIAFRDRWETSALDDEIDQLMEQT